MAITYLVIALGFVDNKASMVTCSKIRIEIADSLENSFITKRDVLRSIEKQKSNLIGVQLKAINTHEIEQQLASMQAVKNIEVYKTIDGRLNVSVKQRKPIMRIINDQGQSYYIDNSGQIFPLSSKYTSHVIIVNGNIDEPFEINPNTQVMNWAGDEIEKNSPLICKLYDFAKFIVNDSFWRAQITQIYVDDPNNIELIPRVGPHTILLGNLDDYELKLAKLKLFYKTALPEEGWNKYKQINLKYSNQIVCTKR
jgi:cell division protein FtsQ